MGMSMTILPRVYFCDSPKWPCTSRCTSRDRCTNCKISFLLVPFFFLAIQVLVKALGSIALYCVSSTEVGAKVSHWWPYKKWLGVNGILSSGLGVWKVSSLELRKFLSWWILFTVRHHLYKYFQELLLLSIWLTLDYSHKYHQNVVMVQVAGWNSVLVLCMMLIFVSCPYPVFQLIFLTLSHHLQSLFH